MVGAIGRWVVALVEYPKIDLGSIEEGGWVCGGFRSSARHKRLLSQSNPQSKRRQMDITKENLRESGLGKIIFFYTRSKRVQPEISRLSNDLYDRWSRLILNQGASDRQVQRGIETRDEEDEDMDRSDDEPPSQRRKKRDPGAQLLNRRVEERDAEDGDAKTTRLPSQIVSVKERDVVSCR
jgi:hypothetical protein